MKLPPPEKPLKFLRWFCREDYLEEIEGDLVELFEQDLDRSPRLARRAFAWRVLKYLRPGFIRSFHSRPLAPTAMLKHNLLVTLRSFQRYKASFLINLIGLTAGLACALVLYLWIQDELHIDRFHANDARLYQVLQHSDEQGNITTGTGTAGILARAITAELPEVEQAITVVPAQWFSEKGILTVGDTRLRLGGQYAAPNYFQVFTCPLVAGDPTKALTDKYSILLSETTAQRLFGTTEDLLGKAVEWKVGLSTGLFHITGIFEDVPPASSNPFDVMLSVDVFLDDHPWLREWGNSDPNTFVVVRPGADIDALNSKLTQLLQRNLKDSRHALSLQRYADRYLHGRYENGVPAGGRILYVQLFSVIAVFLVGIACINFMNLSTARASRRMKEVGIKKAIGAARSALVVQYLQESLLMAFLSLSIAVVAVWVLLPSVNDLTGKTLLLTWDMDLVLPAVGITLLTGLLAGSYPALYLSGFRPALVLKGKPVAPTGGLLARRGLVVFQFVISMILIVTVLVVYRQMDYIQSRNLGYNRDHVVMFELEITNQPTEEFLAEGGTFEHNVEAFLQEIRQIPGVIQVANSAHNITGYHGRLGGIDWREGEDDNEMMFSNLEVGYDFIQTLDIPVVEGKPFLRDSGAGRRGVILNQAAIDRMGLTDPVGKTLRLWGQEKEIVGVVENFHFTSLYEKVEPLVMQLEPRGTTMMIRLRAGEERETLARLETLYHRHMAGLTFDYRFLDDTYQALYAAEQRIATLSRYFAGIAILISCLGLFGLAAFTAERREKEIGIRKILGSGDARIVWLLSADFAQMVLIAVIVAIPVSYVAARQWLSGFAYSTSLDWWLFAGAGVLALLVALLTVALQTIRAARVNPVQSLTKE
ncbi:ABC transporter permease [Parachryseolinea silvisoli]|uniref:ABC transporter permease n=1 Tax=Parachryseolinea silvisoli TaxID=2873601 RepID=UPI002265A6DC|nr:ABC transporter permease [Parachryseolinea silvisoli]MCD9019905.1 ABC transporter permease [Parachryseolinea silvisoli]